MKVGRANPTNSGLFRRLCNLLERHIACNRRAKNISSARQSQRRASSMATAAGTIHHAAWGAAVGMFLRLRAHDKETALLLFNSVRANVSTIYRISFARTQGRIETE